MKIYIVTAGTYSDYSILAVFTDEKAANEYITEYNKAEYKHRDDAVIEEWDTDLPPTEWYYTLVRMTKEGEVLETTTSFGDSDYSSFDVNGNFFCKVKTKDVQRAIKVTNEKRAQLIAEDRWNPDAHVLRGW